MLSQRGNWLPQKDQGQRGNFCNDIAWETHVITSSISHWISRSASGVRKNALHYVTLAHMATAHAHGMGCSQVSLAPLCAHGYALRLPFSLCSWRPDSCPSLFPGPESDEAAVSLTKPSGNRVTGRTVGRPLLDSVSSLED